MQRGDKSKNYSGQKRYSNSETEDVPVERYLENARDKILGDFLEEIESPNCQQNSEHSRNSRDQHTLCQKLAYDTGASRPESCPNGDFLATRDETGEEQIGHVGTRHQKDTSNCSKESQQHRALTANQIFLKRHRAHPRL